MPPSFSLPQLPIDPPEPREIPDRATLLAAAARQIASGTIGKTALADQLGVSRAAAASLIATLLESGLIAPVGRMETGAKGRPAEGYALAPQAGVLLIADLGARHAHIAAVDLQQNVLAIEDHAIDVADGPEAILEWAIAQLTEMHAKTGSWRPVRAVVAGLPARLDRTTRIPVRPGIMPGWDGYPVSARLQQAFDCPIVQENDVNLIAQGEAARLTPDQLPLVAVKLGTGIGAGITDGTGELVYGYDGAAGEIGHIPVRSAPPVRCTCGNEGCLEAAASLPAMVARYDDATPGHVWTEDDRTGQFLDLVRDGDPGALDVVREAAENVGEALAVLCNTLNPRRIVVSGDILEVTDEFLAGIRSVTYRLARPLATRNLTIRLSSLRNYSAIAGATVLGLRAVLSPENFRQRRPAS